MRRCVLFIVSLISVVVHAADLLPRWGDRFWQDSLPATMRESYITFGEQYAGKAWKTLPATVFSEYKKIGNRVHYEQLMFEKRRQLAALVVAELAEGQRRFLPDIINGLQSTLEETWWGLPAHYKTELPVADDQTVDLFNAETASLVAYTRFVLSEELDHFSPLLTRRIDQEITRRILQPAVKSKYWWKTAGMNWNPWICSNWLACVLFCEHDEARKAEAVRQIESACNAFMNAYPADGGCDEGPHYWDRAAASLFETLYLLGNTKDNEKLKAMESYIYKMYIGNGYAVNFADAHGNRAMLNVNIAYPFGLITNDQVMRQYAAYVGMQGDILHKAADFYDKSGNWPSLARELIFLKHIQSFIKEQSKEPVMTNVWLPDLQIMTAREPFVAFKGGNNGENHNHNDVGSLIVYADDAPLLIDPGVGEYSSKTFSKQRYEIWTMQSDYHNLPLINGFSQRDGKQYAARLISYKPNQLTLDLSGAYPKEAKVSSWKRAVKVKKNRQVEVTEDFCLDRFLAPTQLMFITPIEPKTDKVGKVQLGSHFIGYDARQMEATIEDISHLLDPVLQQMWGKQMYRIVLTVKGQTKKAKLKYYIK